MALISKSTKSYVKERYSNSTDLATGFRKIKFADKPGEGALGINTASLSAPSEMTDNGFINPSSSTLAGLRLRSLRDNLIITSSLRGRLEDYADYVVVSQSKINFVGFTAEEDEFFICTLDSQPTTGVRVVDASVIRATGTLLAGETDINIGAYQVGKYPSAQIGQVMLMIDGVVQLRNVANATAAPAADGNYQELDAGGGFGTIIRLNEADADNDRTYAVVSTEALAEKPTESMLADLESIQGQIDVMVQDLALATGNLETKYQAAPNNIDLRAFGDRVFALETDLGDTDGSTTPAGVIGEVIQDTDVVTGLSTATTATTAQVTLTPGKWLVNASQVSNASATNNNDWGIFHLTTNPSAAGDAGTLGDNQVWYATNEARGSGSIAVYLNITSTTTYYLRGFGSLASGTVSLNGKILATRIR